MKGKKCGKRIMKSSEKKKGHKEIQSRSNNNILGQRKLFENVEDSTSKKIESGKLRSQITKDERANKKVR